MDALVISNISSYLSVRSANSLSYALSCPETRIVHPHFMTDEDISRMHASHIAEILRMTYFIHSHDMYEKIEEHLCDIKNVKKLVHVIMACNDTSVIRLLISSINHRIDLLRELSCYAATDKVEVSEKIWIMLDALIVEFNEYMSATLDVNYAEYALNLKIPLQKKLHTRVMLLGRGKMVLNQHAYTKSYDEDEKKNDDIVRKCIENGANVYRIQHDGILWHGMRDRKMFWLDDKSAVKFYQDTYAMRYTP